MRKYSKIFWLGHEDNKDIFSNEEDIIYIEEKIDGANFRFYINDTGKIIFGSRTRILDLEKEDQVENKNFLRCVNYIKENLKDKDLSKYKGLIFYGENCIKHTIKYDLEKIPPFIGFDIYDGFYYNRSDMEKVFKELKLHIVPLIGKYKVKEVPLINDDFVPITKYAPKDTPNQKAEGVVIKNETTGIRAKYVRDKFKEDNRKIFGGKPLNKYDDTELINYKYCSNYRIDKSLFKLLDDGHDLELNLMKYLPSAVYEDLMEEEGNKILFSNYKVDFRLLRKLITKRALEVLKNVIINNKI